MVFLINLNNNSFTSRFFFTATDRAEKSLITMLVIRINTVISEIEYLMMSDNRPMKRVKNGYIPRE